MESQKKCTAEDCWFKPNNEISLDPSDGEKVKLMTFRKFGKNVDTSWDPRRVSVFEAEETEVMVV